MKHNLHQKCIDTINENINVLQKNINSAQETANEDTKSSAGDKYETTRAMMQIEIQNYTKRLLDAQNTKNILCNMIFPLQYLAVGVGALVITNQGRFFVGVGLGQMLLENEKYFVISPESPIGNLLMGKKIGEKFTFNQKEFVVLEII